MTEKCDCLNWCGDDPDLHSGKVAPCERAQRAAQEQALASARAAERAKVEALIDKFDELLAENPTHIFELLYERSVGWHVYIDRGVPGTSARYQAAIGQGTTPGQACASALAALKAVA